MTFRTERVSAGVQKQPRYKICMIDVPTMFAIYTIHLRNGGCKQATERTSKRSSREENRGTDSEFLSTIPTTEIVVDTREQTSFCNTQEEPRNGKTRK